MKPKAVSPIVLVMLFLFMLTLASSIQPVGAAISPYSPAGAASIEPSTATVPVNQLIPVEIIITNITDCAGIALGIDYDATILEFIDYTFDTDPANPLSPSQMAPAPADRVDTNASLLGKVQLATVWKAAVPTYSYAGDSVAVEITFKGKIVGSSSLILAHAHAVDYYGNDIYFGELNNSSITVAQAHTLTIYSSPSGVTFTVDGAPHVTPWSGTYIEGASVSLIMPSAHSGYVWSNWLEDGSPNRMRTVMMDANITLTGVYELLEFVGGKAIPISIPTNNPASLVPYIGLTILSAVAAATVVYVKKRKKQ